MPYDSAHKPRVRARIVDAARVMFIRHGYEGVSIDQIMAEAGLTRGGFYNHFKNKEALFAAAIESFLSEAGRARRRELGIDLSAGGGIPLLEQVVDSYLSKRHLGEADGQCPLIALPSDTARAGGTVRDAYQRLFGALASVFETNLTDDTDTARETALAITALCIGGMVLARTVTDDDLADEIREAARSAARRALTDAKQPAPALAE